MTSPVCDRCEHYVSASNRRWPGFCSPWCRDEARRDREAATAARAQRRAAARERRLSAAAYLT